MATFQDINCASKLSLMAADATARRHFAGISFALCFFDIKLQLL